MKHIEYEHHNSKYESWEQLVHGAKNPCREHVWDVVRYDVDSQVKVMGKQISDWAAEDNRK